jgi:hypothetical protein
MTADLTGMDLSGDGPPRVKMPVLSPGLLSAEGVKGKGGSRAEGRKEREKARVK